MTSTADPSIAQLRQEFEALVTYVTSPESHAHTASEVERTLFRRLLALGLGLLRLFFHTRAHPRRRAPARAD